MKIILQNVSFLGNKTLTIEEKVEIDNRSVYVGNVSVTVRYDSKVCNIKLSNQI